MDLIGLLKRRRNELGKRVRKAYEAKQTNYRMVGLRDWTVVQQNHSNTLTGVQIDNLLVFTQTNGTNMQIQYTENTMENVMTETSEQYQAQTSPTTTYSLVDFHARLSAWQENGGDLMTPEGHSFLKSLGFSETKDPDILFSKTSKVYLVTTLAKLSRQYLGFSPTLGMECSGRYLIQKTSVSPKTGSGSSLSDILEEHPDQKYFLSEALTRKLLASLPEDKVRDSEFMKQAAQAQQ